MAGANLDQRISNYGVDEFGIKSAPVLRDVSSTEPLGERLVIATGALQPSTTINFGRIFVQSTAPTLSTTSFHGPAA